VQKLNQLGNWDNFQRLENAVNWTRTTKIIEKWSIKDYNGVSYPSDKLFFHLKKALHSRPFWEDWNLK
jgi:hypothetical protein